MIDVLLERADTVLNAPSSSEDLRAALEAVQEAISTNERDQAEALALANDGAATIEQKRTARAERNRLSNEREFLGDRLLKLSGALNQALDDEAQERLREPYEEERRHREALAAQGPEILAAYERIARWLHAVRESNHRGELLPRPRDAAPLPVTEALARGIAPHLIGNGFAPLIGATKLPAWNAENRATLWPSAPASGVSPAIALNLASIAETDRKIREKWAAMEREAS
jgi:hypothetical protein